MLHKFGYDAGLALLSADTVIADDPDPRITRPTGLHPLCEGLLPRGHSLSGIRRSPRDETNWSQHCANYPTTLQRLHTAAEGGIYLTGALAKRLRAASVTHAFTGGSAAHFIEPAAGFRIVVVYVLGTTSGALSDLGIRRAEYGGENIWLVTPDDDGVFYGAQDRDDGRVRTVSKPQLYVDLLQLPERSPEVADALVRAGLWGQPS